MISVPNTVADIQQMIADQLQENVHLDYKRSAAIRRGSRERGDIAKDVSAFANSDGGVLIYGVEETNQLPVRIDSGIEDSECSREWIEAAVMTGITPRLDDVRIVPLPVSPGHSIYVIKVAKTFRGPHQASDKRYYKRHNFMSVPMEDYEINDVRSRRKRVSPLVTFEVGEWRRMVATFDVRNVGEFIAEDVTFEFPADLPWPQNRSMPPLFAGGISRFPPKQQFRFLYFAFHEVLGRGKRVPLEFSVKVSYYHPEADSRVTDVWPVNFAAYEHTTAIRPEIEDQANDVLERLDRLNEHFGKLIGTLQKLTTIPGSTGLDLSVPTLRNLKRVLLEGRDPAPIHPEGCDYAVFKDLLGVDVQMAYEISRVFDMQLAYENLRAIPGMTEEVLSKIRTTFILHSEPSENAG